LLILYAYLVIFFFFFYFTDVTQLFSDLNRALDFSARLNVFSQSEFFLYNFFSTSFNTFFFYFFIFFVLWRYSFKSINNLRLFFSFLVICFFSFIFWSII
jgi:hypothetical protein